jgi:saccharopine dehydrogenase (NAD+, L-lysine-forming)
LFDFTLGYINSKNINNLTPYKSKLELLTNVSKCIASEKTLKIAVVGPNGRCGVGVINVLTYFNIEFDKINREDTKKNLQEYDIIFNCIVLDKKLNETWFDNNTIFTKSITIVDISCDYNSINNPIKLYEKLTTWKNPVYSYSYNVDIISINNLPSLLPKDSSDEFSEILVGLILKFNNEPIWENNKAYYYNIIKTINDK